MVLREENSYKIDDLLAFDDDPVMVDSWVEPVHVWRLVRYRVLQRLAQRASFAASAHAPSERLGVRGVFDYARIALGRSLYRVAPAEIAIFSTGAVNLRVGSAYTNRLYDPFVATSRSRVCLIEQSRRKRFDVPRREAVHYSDLLTVEASIAGRLRRLGRDTHARAHHVVDSIRRRLPHALENSFWRAIEDTIMFYAAKYPRERRRYERFLRQRRVRAAFVEDASYGGQPALIDACRACGIRVGEFQHGLVSRHHPAYNYGRSFFSCPDLRSTLPDYYLTFGQYWSERTRTPSVKVAIGYPFLEFATTAGRINRDARPVVLLVSDGTLPQFYRDAVVTLVQSDDLQRADIVLKLHPGEVPYVESRYGDLREHRNVTLETYRSVYDLLGVAAVVIGCYSTVLYEAQAFGHSPLVYANELARAHLDLDQFTVFSDLKGMVTLVAQTLQRDRSLGATSGPNRHLWADRPVERWRAFLREEIGLDL